MGPESAEYEITCTSLIPRDEARNYTIYSSTVQVLAFGEPAGTTRTPTRAQIMHALQKSERFMKLWLHEAIQDEVEHGLMVASSPGTTNSRLGLMGVLSTRSRLAICRGVQPPRQGSRYIGPRGVQSPKDNWTGGPAKGGGCRSNHPSTPDMVSCDL